MPFDGSGTFQRVMNWVNDAAANVRIRADRHDQEDDNFAAGLSMTLTKDGQSLPTANIPLNAKRLVNVADPVNPQDAATMNWIQNNVVGGSLIADTAPATAKVGNLWWESDTGNLFLRYDDGNSVQWVQVNVSAPVVRKGQRELVQEQTLSGTGTSFALDYFTGWPQEYDSFELEIDNWRSTLQHYLFGRAKIGSGGSIVTANSSYGWSLMGVGYGGSGFGAGSTDSVSAANSLSSLMAFSRFNAIAANLPGDQRWKMSFLNPSKQAAANAYTPIMWEGHVYEQAVGLVTMSGVAFYAAVTEMTGLHFGVNSGGPISGRVRLWGFRS